MKQVRLTLIGVAHRDPEGFSKLMGVFHNRRPQAVTIELSPLALIFRLRNSASLKDKLVQNIHTVADERQLDVKDLLKRGFIREILSQIDLPFEYAAAKAYSVESGALVVSVDSSLCSRPKLRYFQHLVSIQNLRTLVAEPDFSLERKTEMELARAGKALQTRPTNNDLFLAWSPEQRVEWIAREEVMAKRVRRVVWRVRESRGAEVVHIGGWRHCVGTGLENALHDLNPRIELLVGGNRRRKSSAAKNCAL